jgi:tellurite resistance protein TerC
VTYGVLAMLLAVDLLVVARRPRVPTMREASAWVGCYVGLALLFVLALAWVDGTRSATSFAAGWLTEYSLSVDNLFVFVIIMTRFSVPRKYQQKVLLIGIIMSLVLRGGFIALGAEVITRFSWIFYLFGAFLLYLAVQILRQGAAVESNFSENLAIRFVRRFLPLQSDYADARLTIRTARGRRLTPMVLVFVAIGSTDVLFAIDSIPAIFGLTKDPFIVFTATLFALMGLRQLYFLLGGLFDRLAYLSQGLSVILAFIGLKLLLDALATNDVGLINGGRPVEGAIEIPTWGSLLVIVVALTAVSLISLLGKRGSRGA